MFPDPALVLLDLENQAAGGGSYAEQLVTSVRTLVPAAVKLVAAVAEQNTERFRATCEDMGVQLVVAGNGPSDADRVMLALAHTARIAAPHLRVVVASGDHAFCALAPDLVVTRNHAGISPRLEQAASRVVRLPMDRALTPSDLTYPDASRLDVPHPDVSHLAPLTSTATTSPPTASRSAMSTPSPQEPR